jgi:hypothetical protein
MTNQEAYDQVKSLIEALTSAKPAIAKIHSSMMSRDASYPRWDFEILDELDSAVRELHIQDIAFKWPASVLDLTLA